MALKVLTIDLRAGETVAVNGPASFRLESKSGSVARVSVMADESVKIDRPQPGPAAQQAVRGIKPQA